MMGTFWNEAGGRARSVIRAALPLVAVALALPLVAGAGALAAQEAKPTVAFVGVHVVPMDRERVVPDQTVIVRNGVIEVIGSSDRVDVPTGATRVDARGRYLMPGLAEMHAHIPGANASAALTEQVLFLYLANGITTIRGMLGQPAHLSLKARVAAGNVTGPRIVTSGPSFNGNTVATPEAARSRVRDQAAGGYDFLKIHPGIPLDAFRALDGAADDLGIGFAGHVPAPVGLWRFLEAGPRTIDHLDGYMEALVPADAPVDPANSQFFGYNLIDHVDLDRLDDEATATRRAGVWQVPTMSLFEDLFSDTPIETLEAREENRYVPAQMLAQWVEAATGMRRDLGVTPDGARRFVEIRRTILTRLFDAGVPILLGSDAPQIFNVPGFSIHEELAALAAAGLTPYQVLETGTVNVARFLGVADERGTVHAGKAADLVLLDANPLENLANVRAVAGVMVMGRWIPGETIRERLERYAGG